MLLKDSNADVAASAIALLNVMLRNDKLCAMEGDDILCCFLDEHDAIRRGSADFIFFDTFDDAALIATTAKHHSTSEQTLELDVMNYERFRDDIRELISLVKDRVMDLNSKAANGRKRIDESVADVANTHSPLHCRFDSITDYLVYAMEHKLVVLHQFDILVEALLSTEESANQQHERALRRAQLKGGVHGVREGDVDHNKKVLQIVGEIDLDEFGQIALCFLTLSAMRAANGVLEHTIRNPRELRGASKLSLQKTRADVLPSLPTLLRVFQTDTTKLFAVVQMVPLIPISALNSSTGKQCLDDILFILQDTLFKHETHIRHTRDKHTLRTKDDSRGRTGSIGSSSSPLHLINQSKLYADPQIYEVIGQSLAYLANSSYDYKADARKAMAELVTRLMKQRNSCLSQIKKALHDNLDLCKVNFDNEGHSTQEFRCLQDCFSNLHRINGLLKHMHISQLSFDVKLQTLLESVLNETVHHALLDVLVPTLLYCILWEVKGFNFNNPNTGSVAMLHQLRGFYAKTLHFLCQKLIEQHENAFFISLLFQMLDILFVFSSPNQDKGENENENEDTELVNTVFNHDLFNEITGDAPGVKPLLLQVFISLLDRPLVHDPFDLSMSWKSENEYMRALINSTRLCIYNPVDMLSFGALALSKYHRKLSFKHIKSTEFNELSIVALSLALTFDLGVFEVFDTSTKNCENQICSHSDDIIRQFISHMDKSMHYQLQLIVLEAFKIICEDTNSSSILPESLCKTLASIRGIGTKTVRYFQVLIEKTLDLVINEKNLHDKKYFILLPGLLHIIRASTNTDKIAFWNYLQSLEKGLVDVSNFKDADYYESFREELKKNWMKLRGVKTNAIEIEDKKNEEVHEKPAPTTKTQKQQRSKTLKKKPHKSVQKQAKSEKSIPMNKDFKKMLFKYSKGQTSENEDEIEPIEDSENEAELNKRSRK
ncbi:hypothetical protein RFI_30368 [Reticulomyxa filosa]|uniref:Uncharacterized protein n=1 Tax=Reticulomyxa filosa TaxID=46433 RepID=X6M0U3_RETFI|nr:hypothetical protein RFI_30368 [Reticulomyxa filosa]|eukprot:ETO07027.1 hypothetical protein RFI_30368 [Reticulomyxa filosa]